MLDEEVHNCMMSPSIVDGLKNISVERVREEMLKCFHHNTLVTLRLLDHFNLMRDLIFSSGDLKLVPSLRK